MNKYDRFYDEACAEAKEVINGWMSEKLRSELEIDDHDSDRQWHESSDAFLSKFLSRTNPPGGSASEPDIDIYNEDSGLAVNHLMQNMHLKLASATLHEYESKEKKKKIPHAKDPRIAMEVRQQKVKEARLRREEKVKERLKENIQKKQNDAVARQIVKQEMLEKTLQEKLEEEAIQQEMSKIRKRMLDLKKQTALQESEKTHCKPTDISAAGKSSTTHSHKNSFSVVSSSSLEPAAVKLSTDSEVVRANIRNFELFQKQKVVRKFFQQWVKVVMAKRVAIGKAKALADWHLVLKTWSAWRKYYFEQTAERGAALHQESIKQSKVQAHIADIKHRRAVLKKCFSNWKKFVKIEQFSNELLKEQETTRKKMEALLGVVTSKAKSSKNDLILQTVDDDDLYSVHDQDTSDLRSMKRSTHQAGALLSTQHNVPKHAWQIRRTDVQKLTLKEIEDMAASSPKLHAVTKVKTIKKDNLQPKSSRSNRVEASKQVIAQQRHMITEQKQIIEEQKRALEKKSAFHDVTDGDSTVVTSLSEKSSSLKPRILQPPKRPKSLLAMEKRAEERMRRKEEMQERKREQEKKKIEEMQKEEDLRLKQEEEAKKKKIEELKKMKQLEIEKENAKKAFIAHMQQLRCKAELHYKQTILLKYGLKPWEQLINEQKSRMEIARYHSETLLCGKVMEAWYGAIKEDKEEKQQIICTFYKTLLIRRHFSNWLKYGQAMSILEKKAEIHHNGVLKMNYLRKWERYVTDERLAYFANEEVAAQHNIIRLKRRVFKIIYVYKQNLKRDEIRSQRIADMRRKVAQLLPDFNPSLSQDAS